MLCIMHVIHADDFDVADVIIAAAGGSGSRNVYVCVIV